MTFDPSAAWRKSSYSSATGNCVEVAPLAAGVGVRHSRRPAAGTIVLAYPEWSWFVGAARSGGTNAGGVAIIAAADGGMVVASPAGGVDLRFDADEWSAFLAGAADGEFDFPNPTT